MSDPKKRRRAQQARRRRAEQDLHRDLQGVAKPDKNAGSSQNEYADRDDVDIFGAPIGEVDECNADPQDSWPQRRG